MARQSRGPRGSSLSSAQVAGIEGPSRSEMRRVAGTLAPSRSESHSSRDELGLRTGGRAERRNATIPTPGTVSIGAGQSVAVDAERGAMTADLKSKQLPDGFYVLPRGKRQCVGPFRTYDDAKTYAPPGGHDAASIVTGRWLNHSVGIGKFDLQSPQEQTKSPQG